jgi:hypothetical protein
MTCTIRSPLLAGVTSEGEEISESEYADRSGAESEQAGLVVGIEELRYQIHSQVGNRRQSLRIEGQSNPIQSIQLENSDVGNIAAPVKDPKVTSIHTNSKTSRADLASKEINNTTQLHHSTGTESKGTFVDDNKSIRRSVRLINKCSSDGILTGDQDMLEKSMKRKAWKNLDGPAPQQPSPVGSKSSATHSLDSLPLDICVSNLQRLGFSMGSSKQETNLAIKVLKRIDIDRTRVEPKKNTANNPPGFDPNPFEDSDDEITRSDSILLSQLVRDISEGGFDNEELDTKICDLMAHSRKSKASGKKGHNSNKKLVSK